MLVYMMPSYSQATLAYAAGSQVGGRCLPGKHLNLLLGPGNYLCRNTKGLTPVLTY